MYTQYDTLARVTKNYKYYIIALFGFGFVPSLCLSQDIPRGAETIKITTSLPDSVLFERVVTFLDTEGYTVNRADSKRGIIITDAKASAGIMNVRILAAVKSGVLALKGQWSGGVAGYTFTNEPVLYKGMLGNTVKKSFVILNNAATRFKNSIPGSTIAYGVPID